MTQSPQNIRFNDVRAAYLEQRDEIDAAMRQVIERGDFINGAAVTEFEDAFARYCGAQYCVGTANGTVSLHLALLASGVGHGDEVITSPMTFIATSEAVTHAGARVVFADIDENTLNLSSQAVNSVMTPRTKAILFVHLHGNPSGVRSCALLARRHRLLLVEDAAQAHGARLAHGLGEQRAGTVGVAGCFSFFPGKNLGAFGDAGAVVVNNEALAREIRQLANHGREEKYRHLVEGFNYRLDTLQAAVLKTKLRLLDEQVDRRNRLAAMYIERLADLDLKLQHSEPGTRHARHLFQVQTPRRDELQAALRANQIETGIHYPIPLHLQPAYAHLGFREGSFPVAERLAKETLSLPMYPQLPPEHVERVCDAVRAFFGR